MTTISVLAAIVAVASMIVPAIADSPVTVAMVEGLDLQYDPLGHVDLGTLDADAEAPAASGGEPAAQETGAPPQGPDTGTAYIPFGPVKLAGIDNAGAVRNGPTRPATLETPFPVLIRSIQTYHWNRGRGRRPGTIAMKGPDGQVLGPWRAEGRPGQGGVPNAHWYAEPNVVLTPGRYVIVDSHPASWATNAQAGNAGFYKVEVQQVELRPGPATPAPETGNGAPAAGNRYVNPVIGEFRLDWCLKNGRDCGKPAADAFCRFWGMNEAASFSKAENIGANEPTREILDGALCEKPSCNGFSDIVCR
jgi:hypothetical protein